MSVPSMVNADARRKAAKRKYRREPRRAVPQYQRIHHKGIIVQRLALQWAYVPAL